MPRRGFIPQRVVLPDPVYGTVIVTKLINQIMYDGKRGVAQSVCYHAFETVAAKTERCTQRIWCQRDWQVMNGFHRTQGVGNHFVDLRLIIDIHFQLRQCSRQMKTLIRSS